MQILRQVANSVQQTLTVVAQQVNEMCPVSKRERKFSAATLAQTFVFGFLQNPRARDENLAQMAAICGVCVTPQAISQRFTWPLVKFLRQLLESAVKQLVVAPEVAIPLLQRFHGVYVDDSSTIGLPQELAQEFPGCGGNSSSSAVKVQTRINLSTGELQYVSLEPGRCPDQGSAIQGAALPPGSLRIADLGYFATTTLAILARMRVSQREIPCLPHAWSARLHRLARL
jgi:hypothetical protein